MATNVKILLRRGKRAELNSGDTLSSLPDGLWTIGYCVSPCDKINVEYYYLRTTAALNRYASLYGSSSFAGRYGRSKTDVPVIIKWLNNGTEVE